jgi:hypothetical protein
MIKTVINQKIKGDKYRFGIKVHSFQITNDMNTVSRKFVRS